MLFLHNRQGMSENSNCTNLVGADWVPIQNSKFRSDLTEPSVQFRSDHTDPSVQFRKANTNPSMQFRWGHTEFLFCKMLGKNLDESVRQSHLQTSPGKSSCQDAFVRAYVKHFHTVILQNCHLKIWQPYIDKLAQNFDSFGYTFNMQCLFFIQSPIYYAMLCHAMPFYVMPCTMPCAMCYTAPSSARNKKFRTAPPVRHTGICRGSADRWYYGLALSFEISSKL